jgi:hypothetical protein
MEIKSVSFEKVPNYETVNAGQWVGRVEFKSSNGNCSIPLAPEVAGKLLTVLTPVLVEFSQRATSQIAEILTKQLADSTAPAIDMPKE